MYDRDYVNLVSGYGVVPLCVERCIVVSSQVRRNLIAHQTGQHLHDFAQILIGWRGKTTCVFSEEADLLDNGKVAIVPVYEKHSFSGLSDDSEVIVIDLVPADPYIQALEQACNMSFKDTLFQNSHFISLNSELTPVLDFAANQLERGSKRLSPQLNCQLLSLFMTQLCENFSSNLMQSVTSVRLNTVKLNSCIDKHLSCPLSNAELASVLYLSESHFYYLFQREYGMTPQQYVTSRRMQRAKFLLCNSDISLSILAAELGFSDQSSFSRAYKKYHQTSPSHARRLA